MSKALLSGWISSDRPRRDLSPASRSSSSISPARSPRGQPLARPLPSYLPLPRLPSPPLPPLPPPSKAKSTRVKPPLFVDTSLKYDTIPSLPINSELRPGPLNSAPLIPTRDSMASGMRSVGSWMTSSQSWSRSNSPTDTLLGLDFPAVPPRRLSESQSTTLRTRRSDSAGSVINGFRSKDRFFKTLFNSRTSSNSSNDAVLSTLSSQSISRRTRDASSSSTTNETTRSSSPTGTLLITKPERRDSALPRRIPPRRRSRSSISQPYSPPLTPKSSPFTHHRRKSSVPSSPRTASSRTSKAAVTPPGGPLLEDASHNDAPSNRRTLVPSTSTIDVCIMDKSGDRPGVRSICDETLGVTLTLRAHHRPEEMEFEWKSVTEVDAAGRESTTWEVSLKRRTPALGLRRAVGPPAPSPSLPLVDPVSPFLPSISSFPSFSTSSSTSMRLDDLLASSDFNTPDTPAEESDSSISFYSSSPRKHHLPFPSPHSDVPYQPFFYDDSEVLSSTETDRRGSIPSPPTYDGRVSPSTSLASDRSAIVVSLGDLILPNRYSGDTSHHGFMTEGGHPFRFPRRSEESMALRSTRGQSRWSDTDAESEYGETSWAKLGDGRESVCSQYGPAT